MSHKEALLKLLAPYLLNQSQWTLDRDTPEQKFSAVSIILRNISPPSNAITAILNTEILLLERVEDGKVYSGQVCLPGGKCEPAETIFQTAVRETEQETGIRLKQSDLVGILGESFMAYRRVTHSLFTYAAVFYLYESQEINLNLSEICSYRWLPVSYFMQEEVYRPIVIPIEHFRSLNQFQGSKEIQHFEWPAIDVGLKMKLYGLTLYILAFFISRLEDSLKRTIQRLVQKESLLPETSQRKEAIRKLKEQFRMLEKYEGKVKELYFKSFSDINIVWKEDCALSAEERKKAAETFNSIMRQMFPERPRF